VFVAVAARAGTCAECAGKPPASMIPANPSNFSLRNAACAPLAINALSNAFYPKVFNPYGLRRFCQLNRESRKTGRVAHAADRIHSVLTIFPAAVRT
jgi:NADPH:quinone reductase-like Zn-dependent oxidoreductase